MTPEQIEINALREEVRNLKAEAARIALYQAEKDRLEQEYQSSQQRFRTYLKSRRWAKRSLMID